jgi:hypothetical protein
MVVAVRPDGTVSSTSRSITRCLVALCTSTSGVSPVTVIVSSRLPTRISASTVAVKEPVSAMPSRLNGAKPASVNVTT